MTGKIVKTLSGVRSEFSRLRKDFPGAEAWLSKFLGEAYVGKEISDYPFGKRVAATAAEADEGIETATRFVDRSGKLLAS